MFRCILIVPLSLAHPAGAKGVDQHLIDPESQMAAEMNPDEIERSAIITAETLPGVLDMRFASIDHDGKHALVIVSDYCFNVWAAVFSLWPEILEVALIIAALLLLRRWRRLRRYPTRAPHCQRCGYIIFGDPSCCAECGTELARGGIVIGRPAVFAPMLAAAVSVVALAVYPLATFTGVPRESSLVYGHCKWYSRGLMNLLEAHFPQWADDFCVFPMSMVEIDLRDGKVGRTLYVANWTIDDVETIETKSTCLTAFSADMTRVVVVRKDSCGTRRLCAEVRANSPVLIGFSSDGDRFFYYDTDCDVESVCAINLRDGRVERVRQIPCNLGYCMGPTGPYFELNSSRSIALVHDEPAERRGEPMHRILDLTSGDWIATLDAAPKPRLWGEWWTFSEDETAVVRVDSGQWSDESESRDNLLVTYRRLEDLQTCKEFIVPFEYDESILDLQALGPSSCRLVSIKSLDDTAAVVVVRRAEFEADGSSVTTIERTLRAPAPCDTADWYSEGLRLNRDGHVEWTFRRCDDLGAAVFAYDLDVAGVSTPPAVDERPTVPRP